MQPFTLLVEAQGRKMILVVDDETLVAEALTDILEVLGYEAVTATCGQQATALLDAHGQALRLAIIDLKLPGEDGLSLFGRLKSQQPHLKGILTTGHPPPNGNRIWEEQGFDRCLAKPFSINEVADTVEEILAEETQLELAETGELPLL